MNNKPLHKKTATELIVDLTTKKISAEELLEETINRIDKFDTQINAIPYRDFDNARRQAKEIDTRLAKGEKKPLLGLPMSVKDSFNVIGMPTTWGNKNFKDYIPTENAVAVKRLKDAGAIIIGKSNVPFMLQDWQTYNDLYGTTNNPWNFKLTPGGSSGGAAAALAAGFVSLELGSDLAGSLRAPAHFCGVYSHKPSLELIPMRGTSPPTFPCYPIHVDLVVSGPMARSAADLKLSLDVMAGPDELLDGSSYKLKLLPAKHTALKDYKILVLDSHPVYPTAKSITHALNELVEKLTKAGAKVSRENKDTELRAITENFAFLLGAFGTNNLPEKLYRRLEKDLRELHQEDNSLHAQALRGSVSAHREWLAAVTARDALKQKWQPVFEKYDVILCPAMPTLAFPHDHSNPNNRKLIVDGKEMPYDAQYSWIALPSSFGLPATTAPIAISNDNLPIGIQIIGNFLEDYTTIHFAELLTKEFGEVALTL